MSHIAFIVDYPTTENIINCVVQQEDTLRVSNSGNYAIVYLPHDDQEIPECLQGYQPLNFAGIEYIIKNNPEEWQ